MSERDPVSELQHRLSQLEANLAHIRAGKAPSQPVDLLSWRANAVPAATASWLRTLREDWQGLGESIRTWALRFEARLGR